MSEFYSLPNYASAVIVLQVDVNENSLFQPVEETDKEDTRDLKVTPQQYESPYSNASIEFALKHSKGQRNYSTLDNEIKEIKDQQLIKSLVRSYQTRGHISASVNPLGNYFILEYFLKLNGV